MNLATIKELEDLQSQLRDASRTPNPGGQIEALTRAVLKLLEVAVEDAERQRRDELLRP